MSRLTLLYPLTILIVVSFYVAPIAQIFSQSNSKKIALGKKLFNSDNLSCNACHSIDGQRFVGASMKGLYGSIIPLTDGSNVKADIEFIKESILEPSKKIRAEYPPVMPIYYKNKISPQELEAIVQYIISLK
ncbi:c-type cytochrome [Leptospira sarikeiensis]|uniref:Cytochrome c domain-containing protein n=1 Tax=Leptospira sarikeiensis TaxID=2484943 RepID=A0A4R9K0U5_9LEPT|nr:cytochrome c [Leptospira sarikeiensis]TGL58741.1 hypothetical protein EHQ64_16960 [Leptospira sarikeiensis]